MAEIRIDLDHEGIRAFLRSEEVKAELQRRADAIARAAGDGMKSSVYMGRDRLRGQVWTGTYEARAAEAEDRALTKALDAGRG